MEVSRGGKELGAEPKSKEEMGYKRWICMGKTGQAWEEQRQKGETGRPKQEVGKQTIPSPISCVQSSPVKSTGPLPQPQKMLPEVPAGEALVQVRKRLSRMAPVCHSLLSLHPGQTPLVNHGVSRKSLAIDQSLCMKQKPFAIHAWLG